uniref:Uncharacterized protein n=1 Tax=Oryza glumipatula TaxID=40148 RepID=A0A0D9YP74_9ORYZ
MGASRIRVEFQAILVMFLLLPLPFLPRVFAAGSSGGNSGELVAGGRETRRKPPAIRSTRFLSGGVPANPGGGHDPPVNDGRRGR